MTKKLIRHGNSLALVIDKPILDLLQISEDTPLELTSDGDRILISPVRSKGRQRKLRESLDRINGTFGQDLRRLAEGQQPKGATTFDDAAAMVHKRFGRAMKKLAE